MGLLNTYMANRNKPGTTSNKIKRAADKVGKAVDKGRDLQKKIHQKKVDVVKGLWNAATTPEKGGKSYGPTGLKYPGTPGPTAKRETPKPSTQKPKASKPSAPKRQNVDFGSKLEFKGPGTLDSGMNGTSLKRITREAPAPKLTAKDIKKNAKNQIKGIKAVAKAEKKDMKLADKKAKSDARNAAVAKRTSERNAAQTARAAGKAALKEAKTASRAEKITNKYQKKIDKLKSKSANIAACGGKMKKKKC